MTSLKFNIKKKLGDCKLHTSATTALPQIINYSKTSALIDFILMMKANLILLQEKRKKYSVRLQPKTFFEFDQNLRTTNK